MGPFLYLRNAFALRSLTSPNGIRQPRKPVNGECLGCEQNYSDLDDREISRFRQDSQGDDHRGGARRWMVDAQEDHNRPSKRKRKGGGENAGPIDFAAESFREGVHARDSIGSEAAK